MRFRARRTVTLGPLRLNLTQSGFSSWGVKVGPWSWNSRTRKNTVDTPGPGYVQTKGRKKKRKR